jgi:hypothetical protein
MTIQQMRKKELQESGAMTYEEWKQRKQVAVAAERQQLTVGACIMQPAMHMWRHNKGLWGDVVSSCWLPLASAIHNFAACVETGE